MPTLPPKRIKRHALVSLVYVKRKQGYNNACLYGIVFNIDLLYYKARKIRQMFK